MIKTDAQLARTELELDAIDSALSMLRYLDYRPKNGFGQSQDSWKGYCQALDSKLADAHSRLKHFHPELFQRENC